MLNKKNTSKKQGLIILSDLWGAEKSDWITYYTTALKDYYAIKYYDSRILGEIAKRKYSEKELHAQFINGGIERAVTNLLMLENKNSVILGFSIGGYIAWKACNSGLRSKKLIAVSSTRLRYETKKPSMNIELIYGEDDAYKPDTTWFEKLDLHPIIYTKTGHDLYQNKKIAKNIVERIIQNRSE